MFSCSIAENIAYGADNPSAVTAEQVEKVAEVANAAAFIRNFPQGFNTVVGEKGVLLSGTCRSALQPDLSAPRTSPNIPRCSATFQLGFCPSRL